tara:strand:+ start:1778 stop:2410 length:633 start_codon:yes stop_codon:yes gene_type:complete
VAVVVAVVVAEAEVLVQPAAAAATVLLPRRALVSPNLRTSSPASSRYYSTARRLHSCSPWLTFPVKLSVTSFVLPVVPEGGVVFAVTPPILSVTERRRLNRRLWPLQKPRRDRRRGFLSRVQVVVSASRPSISSRRASFAVPVSMKTTMMMMMMIARQKRRRLASSFSLSVLSLSELKNKNKSTPALLLLLLLLLLLFFFLVVVVVVVSK